MPSPTFQVPINKDDALQSAYAVLSGEDATERACKAIPDEQCTSVPRNFVLNVCNGACTKLAEQLVSPSLVLPWIVSALGAPVALAGWFAPIKQTGSMLPQLAVAAVIRRLRSRKWAWAAAGTTQALALFAMALAIMVLPGAAAAWALLGLFALFSVVSGVGSVAFQDVTGKTVPKGVRGRMLANRATIGGALTLAAAIVLKVFVGADGDIDVFLILIAAAGTLWLLAAAAFAVIKEVPGASEGGRNMLAELRAGLHLFRDDPGFAKFLGMRVLLLIAVELAVPYFAILAQQTQGTALSGLGVLIFAVGFANMVASYVWGDLADRSARKVCAAAGLVGATAALLALGVAFWLPDTYAIWGFALVFVVAGIAEAGVRLGRKTYLVDAAPKEERPFYTALSNTIAGVVALLAGSIGLAAAAFGVIWVIAGLAALGVVGALFALAMPEAEAA